jgi:hypothetical protein
MKNCEGEAYIGVGRKVKKVSFLWKTQIYRSAPCCFNAFEGVT